MKNPKEETKPKKKKTVPLLIAGALTTIALSVGGGVLGATLMQEDGAVEDKESPIVSILSLFEKEEETFSVALDPFLTNLKGTQGLKPGMIRMGMSLSVTGEDNKALVESKEAAVRDKVLSLLRQQTRSSVHEVADSSDLVLKGLLVKELNALFEDDPIDTLFLTEMVIQ